MDNRTIMAAVAALMMALCHAVDASAQGAESVALPFVRIDRDPVSSAMAGAGIASPAATAYASFRNPAVIPFSEVSGDVALSIQQWAPSGANSTAAAFGYAGKVGDNIGLAVGGAYVQGEEYDVISASGSPLGSFTPKDLQVNAGLSVRLMSNLSLGVNARYASSKLTDDDSYSAFAADAFVLYHLDGLNLTAGVSDIGSSVKGSDGTYKLPAAITAGAAYSLAIEDVHSLDLAVDADYFLAGAGKFAAAAGIQYGWSDTVFIRAGYHYADTEAVIPSFASVGAGVKFSGVHIDISYLTASPIIGNTVTLGLGYRF